MKKEVYLLEKKELFEQYGTDFGLTTAQAAEKKEQHGENILEETGKKSTFRVFLEQFQDLLVVILIIAAIISMLTQNVESAIVILAVIVLNAVLGTIQYVKAEKSLASLRQLSSPQAKVLRDGKKQEIPSRDVVPGDILLLEAGDMVVADGRILANYSLQVNESPLTGESANVEKAVELPQESLQAQEAKVPLGDRVNMVFSGSLATYGRADVLVTGTGMHTEMGKIAGLMNSAKSKKTPLQISLDDFSKKLAILIMIICAIVFALRIWQKEPVLDSLVFAVALAVAAIPEALGSLVTIVQAMGTGRMAAEHAIIRDLKAVESLGCVSVICSDKTGTLTQNKMTVTDVYVDGQDRKPETLDMENDLHRQFVYTALLNNDASIMADGKEIGDPTEVAMITMGRQVCKTAGAAVEEGIRAQFPRIGELPFDSDRKLMSTMHEIDGETYVFVKGAVNILLERTPRFAVSCGTAMEVRSITEVEKEQILAQNEHYSKTGLRVLGFAFRTWKQGEDLNWDGEQDLTFLGLTAMTDPPRPESAVAVKEAIGAGIRPVMITGDHKITATAIASQIGIFTEGDLAVTGQELDEMSEEELAQKLEHISVYARVSPKNKIRIVDAWQKKGNVVAMTGDGVNDAPALKKADVGVAMGITGTEVAKDAAAMILTDDNFATIIKAVQNGRSVYRNICNAILFLLSGNLAAVLVVLFCSVTGLDAPFEPVHLLFINLLTDSLPALAIGMEPVDRALMKNKPRDPKERILTSTFTIHLALSGILIGIVTLGAYFTGLKESVLMAETMAFATLALARLFHGFNCRCRKSVLQAGLRSNLWIVGAFFLGFALLAIVLVIPGLHRLFSVSPMQLSQFGWILGFAVLPTVILQLYKLIRYRRN